MTTRQPWEKVEGGSGFYGCLKPPLSIEPVSVASMTTICIDNAELDWAGEAGGGERDTDLVRVD